MNYENLKDAIVAVIKQNGNEEITGNLLQQVLVAMVNSLGSGYQFRGIATPETNPGTPDQRVFYLASAAGTYADFGVNVSDEICALVYDTAWHKQTIVALDQEPTEDSGNLISSGAIYTALQNLADVYMELVEDADEDHIATFNENGQVKDSGLSLDDVAKAKGAFPELFAGFAGNLVDTRSAGTRQGPFAFRQSGGDGVNYMRKILGRTEAWNQLCSPITISESSFTNGVKVNTDGNAVIVVVDTGGATATRDIGQVAQYHYGVIGLNGHKRLFYGAPQNAITAGIKLLTGYADITPNTIIIGTPNAVYYGIRVPSGTPAGTYVFYPQVTSLTLLGRDDLTSAEFLALHPLPYYNYNAGVLKNNAATGLETTGFNQYNPTTGTAQVIAGKTYYIGGAYTSISQDRETITPENHLFSPANTGEVVVIGGNDTDTIINLSDPDRNGEYEPYWKRERVLGITGVTGIPEGGTEADRVTIFPNGMAGVGTAQDMFFEENGVAKAKKVMGVVDMGTINWLLGGNGNMYTVPNVIPSKPSSASNVKANVICPRYTTAPQDQISLGQIDKIVGISSVNTVMCTDLQYTTAADFKAGVSGVPLCYELATPVVYTDLQNADGTPFVFPKMAEVDNLGTEKRLPEDTADNSQGPFECDSNYSISTANLVRKLSEL